MDYIRWRGADGRTDVGRRDVPFVATHYAFGGVVSKYRDVGADWGVLCDRDCEAGVLCGHGFRGQSWDLDFPKVVCGCGIREWLLSRLFGLLLY